MPASRILYFCHDNPEPSGGVRMIYAHVRHLVRNGHAAFVVHQSSKFRPTWFAEEVPTLDCDKTFMFYPEDVAIIPEDYRGLMEAMRDVPVRKKIFCQNHFYIFEGMGTYTSWQQLGISGVFAASEVIADFVRSVLGWKDVPVVHDAIDHQMFRLRPKRLQIAYMPRKRMVEAEFMRRVCMQLLGPGDPVDWVAINDMPESKVAEVLGESAIFLSLCRIEGFGMPPIEAMASGCVVVGFHGQGAREYATPENGFWCQEDDPVDCARQLAEVVRRMRGEDAGISQKIRVGMETAAKYTFARQEQDLLAALPRLLAI